MDIRRAKDEIRNSIQAYLLKDELGEYVIPQVHQRPILLMGPPGIGKTAIVEQVARECGVALVAYTITHHTRQSAVGLPLIEKREYGGKEYAITEYTMSEIIAAVHEKMRRTGLKEGILFIDEINCVSETLAPTMLQFLQQKTFGSHPVPQGWIIVAAGNPPGYNKSVRDFDIVTLDRVKRMDVEESLPVWQEYAVERQLHRAILTYLELKPENFYRVETTVEGKRFVTARGWEDLSRILYAYETLGIHPDEALTYQYLQHPGIARDFAHYYELYRKYQKDYQVEDIFEGRFAKSALESLRRAPFDERLSVTGLLLSGLVRDFGRWDQVSRFTDGLYEILKVLKDYGGEELPSALTDLRQEKEEILSMQREARMVEGEEYVLRRKLLRELEHYELMLKQGQDFDGIREDFSRRAGEQEESTELAGNHLDAAFAFLEEAFGESQEMVIFLTELSLSRPIISYIREYGCQPYQRYSRLLLSGEQEREILAAIESLGMN